MAEMNDDDLVVQLACLAEECGHVSTLEHKGAACVLYCLAACVNRVLSGDCDALDKLVVACTEISMEHYGQGKPRH